MCPMSCVMCHVSHVTFHVSNVMCHMLCITCHVPQVMSLFFFLLFNFIFYMVELVGEGSVIYARLGNENKN